MKSAVLILTCPLHGDQQAVRAVRRGLVRAHGGLGLVVEELPECRVLPAADAPTELTGEPCGFPLRQSTAQVRHLRVLSALPGDEVALGCSRYRGS